MVISWLWLGHGCGYLMVTVISWPSRGHGHLLITIILCSGSSHCNGHCVVMSLSLHGQLMATITSGSPQGHDCAMANPRSSLGPNHLMVRVVAVSWSWSQSRSWSQSWSWSSQACVTHGHSHGHLVPVPLPWSWPGNPSEILSPDSGTLKDHWGQQGLA